jgi:UDP-N-acetylmuramate--alanine ligase
MFFKPQRLHFTGIGGIGMSGIAEVLLNLGYEISGSDLKLSPVTDRLARLGATIREGHDRAFVEGAKALVISSAVQPDNPEVVEARRLQIPVIPRGELLAELMRMKYGIAVAGSHGKTTTTSMVAAILSHASLDPTVVVGGRVKGMGGSNARIGRSEFLVVESDESDGSFLKLAPILAIVTNIDREHLDHYGSIENILDAFTDFVNKVPFYGAAILCLDDENVKRILPRVTRRTVTYGLNPQADVFVTSTSAAPGSSEFSLRVEGQDLGTFQVGVPGPHNVLNATAAVAAALELEVAPALIREGISSFSGVDRRFQIRGAAAGVTVIDDYGHHPTEIRATLETARLCGYSRILVLFQPHRYTRTHALMDDFARSFHQADALFVLDIYAASETPIEGVDAQALIARLRDYGHRAVEYAGGMEEGIERIAAAAAAGDAVITLGAGSVYQAGDRILELLRAGSPESQTASASNTKEAGN